MKKQELLDNTRLLLPVSDSAGLRATKVAKDLKKTKEDRSKFNRIALFRSRRLAGQIIPDERVCGCGKIPISMPGARIYVAGDKGKYFTGVMNCGSVWNCPVCAKKIGLHRAQMLTEFLRRFQSETAKQDGKKYSLGFLTLTVRHNQREYLKDVLNKLLNSFRDIEQSRIFRDEKKRIGYIGCVRAVEVKHGGNGWHPHLHLLLVGTCSDQQMKDFSDFFIREWLATNPDGSPDAQKFVPVMNEQGISDYITKWDASAEMTLGSTDKLTGKSFTPFQFLELWSRSKITNPNTDRGKFLSQYGDLFREYSGVMKGKKQLTLSRQLIKEYEILTGKKFSMKSDEEINVEQQHEKPVVEIEREIFKEIASLRIQAEFLNEIEFKGIESCVRLLNKCQIPCEWDRVENVIHSPHAEVHVSFVSAGWKEFAEPFS